ncbi:Uncharacterised protein [Mycobacteroides abscessus subsp. abscessus]|uniref:hypothetical protein n=1 Tax=Mycobacteroides abscessus TaxID=36809 RepID=UPI000927F2D9|nr:hypothetical protein [Mycobacteroides abscessus]SHQ67568.1 Uncharacterised protein [Mycobacteroides abscessus subsp. abscessus]SHR91205.1 Uncharacterised protein [Mycobacteroides abscessus subsp. abscessus]SIH64347.1 Uncharacterised protein [Mycobacteroides abscessus subsp. abscessus]
MSEEAEDQGNENPAPLTPWWRAPGMWKIWLPMVLFAASTVWLIVQVIVAVSNR